MRECRFESRPLRYGVKRRGARDDAASRAARRDSAATRRPCRARPDKSAVSKTHDRRGLPGRAA
ncbi:hypothetical protein AQ477_26945 [Burkholderia thailandensis]|nr:hypothetical protein AQ477_26945 [Burkholderia thailandensis]KXF59478.1 hypothetical protein AQ476_19885 [Burkholderia thailandensis]